MIASTNAVLVAAAQTALPVNRSAITAQEMGWKSMKELANCSRSLKASSDLLPSSADQGLAYEQNLRDRRVRDSRTTRRTKFRAIEAAAAKLCDAVPRPLIRHSSSVVLKFASCGSSLDSDRLAHDHLGSARRDSRAWFRRLAETQLESKLVRETRERNCGYLSILWNRRVMLLTDMPAVRFGDDPRTLI